MAFLLCFSANPEPFLSWPLSCFIVSNSFDLPWHTCTLPPLPLVLFQSLIFQSKLCVQMNVNSANICYMNMMQPFFHLLITPQCKTTLLFDFCMWKLLLKLVSKNKANPCILFWVLRWSASPPLLHNYTIRHLSHKQFSCFFIDIYFHSFKPLSWSALTLI